MTYSPIIIIPSGQKPLSSVTMATVIITQQLDGHRSLYYIQIDIKYGTAKIKKNSSRCQISLLLPQFVNLIKCVKIYLNSKKVLAHLNSHSRSPLIIDSKDGCLLGCSKLLHLVGLRSSEISINIYQTTRCYILKDSHLHTRRHENLKFHNIDYNLMQVWETFK
jgi:hypothetical protein